jgi:hypothetical protein
VLTLQDGELAADERVEPESAEHSLRPSQGTLPVAGPLHELLGRVRTV